LSIRRRKQNEEEKTFGLKMPKSTQQQHKKRVAATRSRKHTSATISAVDDDGTGHAGCMLDLPSAHRSNLLNSSM
jgi:hypothetical protein